MKTEGNGTVITDWLDEHGDPEIDRFVEKNTALIEKVHRTLKTKGWKKSDLAKAMGKNPSEVSKWLSGLHNLTLKSIVKMEMALEVVLINTELHPDYTSTSYGPIATEPSKAAEEAEKYQPTKTGLEFPDAV